MKVNFNSEKRGISLEAQEKKFSMVFPEKIWQNYKDKAFFLDNYALLSTICMPLISGVKELQYNTCKPLFHEKFSELVLGDIPSSTEDYKRSTKETIEQFKKTKYVFSSNAVKTPILEEKSDRRAIIPLSCGKDSLLSLGIAQEIGLKPVGIYIDDTVSPSEDNTKIEMLKQIEKHEKIKSFVVVNSLEKFNDFETWKKAESCLGYGHMVTSFCFAALPFLEFYNAKYIVLGNQQDLNWGFVNKEGYKAYQSFDQTSGWQAEQDKMIKEISSSRVTSLIRPLTNLSIMKILFSRYKNLAKYMVSCGSLDASKEKRWCLNCSTCARRSVFILAVGGDPEIVTLHPMLEKKHEKFYSLFGGKEAEHFEFEKNARGEQLLAFYLAYKNGVKGYLIDKFKHEFLKEAEAREDELRKFFFSLHEADIPKEIKSNVLSIYREELKGMR